MQLREMKKDGGKNSDFDGQNNLNGYLFNLQNNKQNILLNISYDIKLLDISIRRGNGK